LFCIALFYIARRLFYNPVTMLFAVKRHLPPALLAALLLTVISFVAMRLLELSWSLAWSSNSWLLIGLGLLLIVLSDAIVHGLLWLMWRGRYLSGYAQLVGYFSPQTVVALAGGALLAAAEELFMRGVVLESALSRLQWGPVAAIILASAVFMLLHLIPRPRLSLFAIWAFWESALLGLVYVLSGSLLVTMVVHALHDAGGFALFALQRRYGWLMGSVSIPRAEPVE
jgi:membrane protease YdiL (CAAX protease family)